jgi:sugar phosphate isomerase/epimerase
MAIENHIDFTSDEIVEILSNVDSPYLRVNLDTGNSIRMFEDSVEAARKLAPYAAATHIKDLGVGKGSPREFAFWPSVPLGRGIIDIAAIVSILKEARYRGLFCVEIDYLKGGYGSEDEAVEKSIEYLRGLATPHPG